MSDVIQEHLFEPVDPDRADRAAQSGQCWKNDNAVAAELLPSPEREASSTSRSTPPALREEAFCEPIQAKLLNPSGNISEEVKVEIRKAASIVANLGSQVKNCGLAHAGRVELMFLARYGGNDVTSSIARLISVNRVTLCDWLKYGEDATKPAVYAKFRMYWDLFYELSINQALDIVRQAAHAPGNYKAAMEYLKLAAKERYADRSASGNTTINVDGDFNAQVNNMTLDELQEQIAFTARSLPEAALAAMLQKLPEEKRNRIQDALRAG